MNTFTKHECNNCGKNKLVYISGSTMRKFKCSTCGSYHYITKNDKLSHYTDNEGGNVTHLK